MRVRAVMFDWRGTLVTTLTEREWIREALRSVGRPADAADVEAVLAVIAAANGDEDRLDADEVDSDAARHRGTFMAVFAEPVWTSSSRRRCTRSSPILGATPSR